MLKRIRQQLHDQWAGFLALFLVIAGGGAYAAFDPIGSDGDVDACFERRSGDLDLLKGKKCGKRERRITWAVTGPQGETGPPGTPGEQGPPGVEGPAGTARAYAHVLANGTLDAARTKNVIDVRPTCAAPCTTVPPPGPSAHQCFKLAFTPTNAVATTEYDYGHSVVVGVAPLETYGPSFQCPPGYDAARAATTDETGALSATGFFIAFN